MPRFELRPYWIAEGTSVKNIETGEVLGNPAIVEACDLQKAIDDNAAVELARGAPARA